MEPTNGEEFDGFVEQSRLEGDGEPLKMYVAQGTDYPELYIQISFDGNVWYTEPTQPGYGPNDDGWGFYYITDRTFDISQTIYARIIVLLESNYYSLPTNTVIKYAGNHSSNEPQNPPGNGPNEPGGGGTTPENGPVGAGSNGYIPNGAQMRIEMQWQYGLDGASTQKQKKTGTSFLIQGDLSNQVLDQIALARAQALAKVLTTDVLITGVACKQRSDIGQPLLDIGYTRYIPVNVQGTVALLGDKTTSDEFKLKVVRSGNYGRPGFMELSYCMTTAEVQAWQRNGTVPTRFEKSNVYGANAAGGLYAGLLAIQTIYGVREVFETNPGGVIGTYRDIVKYKYASIDIETAPNVSPSEAVRFEKGAQAQLNSMVRSIKRAMGRYNNANMPAGVASLVAQLRAQAQAYMATIPPINRSHLKIDPILFA